MSHPKDKAIILKYFAYERKNQMPRLKPTVCETVAQRQNDHSKTLQEDERTRTTCMHYIMEDKLLFFSFSKLF